MLELFHPESRLAWAASVANPFPRCIPTSIWSLAQKNVLTSAADHYYCAFEQYVLI